MEKNNLNKKITAISAISVFFFLLHATSASAHVTVKPNEVKAAQFQNFTVSVPVEKEMPTTEIRLVIPEGLESVRPNSKPGWNIDIKKASGEDAKVTEIVWHGGNIAVGLRDEFIFSAKTPAEQKTVQWKAYQKYQDGTVVSWDQQPKEEHGEGESNSGPYSETKVVNELTSSSSSQTANNNKSTLLQSLPGYLALVISLVSLWFATRNKTS